MWKLFCPSPYLLSLDSAFHQGIQFPLPVSLAELLFTAYSGVKMIAPLFEDLIRGSTVIIITAVATTTASVMVSLCSTLQKQILP